MTINYDLAEPIRKKKAALCFADRTAMNSLIPARETPACGTKFVIRYVIALRLNVVAAQNDADNDIIIIIKQWLYH